MKRNEPQPLRTILFVPGNKEDWMRKAVKYGADALVFDLEDAVPEAHRPQARVDGPPRHRGTRRPGLYDLRPRERHRHLRDRRRPRSGGLRGPPRHLPAQDARSRGHRGRRHPAGALRAPRRPPHRPHPDQSAAGDGAVDPARLRDRDDVAARGLHGLRLGQGRRRRAGHRLHLDAGGSGVAAHKGLGPRGRAGRQRRLPHHRPVAARRRARWDCAPWPSSPRTWATTA